MSYEDYDGGYNSNEAPLSLQMATVAVGLHALASFLNTAITAVNFGLTSQLWRPGITLVIALLVASELLAGKKWAWVISLLGLLLGLLRAVLGFGGVSLLRSQGYVMGGELNLILFVIDFVLIIAGLFYLLHRESRRACAIG